MCVSVEMQRIVGEMVRAARHLLTIIAMRDALFGLMVAVAVSIGTGIAALLLVLIAVAFGVEQ